MLDTDLAAPIASTDPHNSLFFPLSPPHTLWFSFSPFLFVSLVLSLSPFSFGLGHLFLLLPYAIRHSVCVYLPPVTHLPHALFSACHSYPRRSVSALADDTRHHLYVILVLSVFFSPFVLLFTLTSFFLRIFNCFSSFNVIDSILSPDTQIHVHTSTNTYVFIYIHVHYTLPLSTSVHPPQLTLARNFHSPHRFHSVQFSFLPHMSS